MVRQELPEGYRKAETIRLDGDRRTAIRLNLWSVGILAGLLLLRVLLGLVFPLIRLRFPDDLLYLSLMIFGILVGAVAVVIVHELIHALFMKLYGAKGIRFGLNSASPIRARRTPISGSGSTCASRWPRR